MVQRLAGKMLESRSAIPVPTFVSRCVGGYKESSSGTREQGKAAREFFTQWKTVYVDPL